MPRSLLHKASKESTARHKAWAMAHSGEAAAPTRGPQSSLNIFLFGVRVSIGHKAAQPKLEFTSAGITGVHHRTQPPGLLPAL